MELKLKIISDLTDKRPPQLTDVFNAVLLNHYEGQHSDSYDKFLLSLDDLTETEEPIPVDSFKEIYETKIANAYHKGQPLIYNREALSLAQPVLRNRARCYSGSLLFYIVF